MNDFHHPTIRLAQVSDAVNLKNLNDVFNDNDDTTLGELETSLSENNYEIVVCAETGTMIVGVCCIQIMRTMCSTVSGKCKGDWGSSEAHDRIAPKTRQGKKMTQTEQMRKVEEWEDSGQAVQSWCREHGIPYTTFINWRTPHEGSEWTVPPIHR